MRKKKTKATRNNKTKRIRATVVWKKKKMIESEINILNSNQSVAIIAPSFLS